MVTGKWAFQFGCLVALEMWREVTKERRHLNHLMDKLVKFEEMKVGMQELIKMNLNLVHQVSVLEEALERRKVHCAKCRWSPSPVQPKRKQALRFASGDGSEERPYVELGLLSKGALVEEEPITSGSGLNGGEKMPVMVMAPSTPLVSLEDLD